jgi:3-oxo-5-alpha-steroid 4-dehydrogenase 1
MLRAVNESVLHQWATWTQIGLGVVTFVALFVISAPYGRHGRPGWGPTLPARLGWVLMESPSCLFFLGLYAMGRHALETVPLIFLALWQLHYVQRTFVFPLLMRPGGNPMPLSIMALAIAFNVLNDYVNARWISELGSYSNEWLSDPRFVVGVVLFLVGFGINLHSDHVLRVLRREGGGYQIPQRGLHRWLASPNYFGEILEWTGWAIATWSLAGASFAIYSFANLAPRAVSNLKWYRERFPEYPQNRRAVIPGIW